VIEEADAFGLVLSEEGKLYDTKAGQSLPAGVGKMPLLTEEELTAFPETGTAEVIPNYVARYWDLVALADKTPAKVIGPTGKLKDRPGFEVDFLTRQSADGTPRAFDKPSVLMPVKGHWRVCWDGCGTILAPGDTMSVPAGLEHAATPSMTGEAALYRVVGTDDPAGPTWQG
jgi:hypothetical protein